MDEKFGGKVFNINACSLTGREKRWGGVLQSKRTLCPHAAQAKPEDQGTCPPYEKHIKPLFDANQDRGIEISDDIIIPEDMADRTEALMKDLEKVHAPCPLKLQLIESSYSDGDDGPEKSKLLMRRVLQTIGYINFRKDPFMEAISELADAKVDNEKINTLEGMSDDYATSNGLRFIAKNTLT